MSDQLGGTYGGYVAVNSTSSASTVTLIAANIALLKGLIPDPSVVTRASAGAHPDFDQIPPHTATKLRAEIDALAVALGSAASFS